MITCVKFGKDSSAAFVSHLDLIRVFERAMRRASLPLSFTQGFSPRPKMVFAHALGVGITSSGEYLDVTLEKELPSEVIFQRLKEALPEHFPLYDVVNLPDSVTPAMAAITHASYVFQNQEEERLLEINFLDSLIYTRTKKGKVVAEDLKP
ncbi:MAG: TIGR03936 family radical SAM-associated protein, partial [Bacillota bacterium]